MLILLLLKIMFDLFKFCNIHVARSSAKTPENKLYYIINFNLSINLVTELPTF